jgi:general secretion pathway protein E
MNQTLSLNEDTLSHAEIANLELAHRFGIEIANEIFSYPFVEKKITKISYKLAKSKGILPLDEKEGLLFLAISRLEDLDVISEMRQTFNLQIKELFCPYSLLEKAIQACYEGQKEQDLTDQPSISDEASANIEEDVYDLLGQKADSSVIRIVNKILLEAVTQAASDIHFEPQENSLVVRYRIDGVLQSRHMPPKDLILQIITRIKVMSKLDIAEHRLPQDGRMKLKIGTRHIDFRVSTVPVVYGERIVLRILDKGNVVLGLDKIGMRDQVLVNFKKHLTQNQGIVLVTGPTGSGKTTTLYSGISEIASNEVNIMTIEDPVEYKLAGMAQIGVNHKIKLDFATGLRHILRQDPDVIMIGEIRDKETAEIAIQASLTGHLVLSTLHTNDAPSALTRLVDMGIEPYLLTSSVIAVVAQRLVRVICPKCKVSYTPSDGEVIDLGLTQKKPALFTFYKGEGCEYCYGSGYKGRRAVYELMNVSTLIKKQLLQSADAMELQRVALSEGMSSLRQEGSSLVLSGITTSSEVIRVTKQIHLED